MTRPQALDNAQSAGGLQYVVNARPFENIGYAFDDVELFEVWNSNLWEDEAVVTTPDEFSPPYQASTLIAQDFFATPTRASTPAVSFSDYPPDSPIFPWGDCQVGIDPSRLEAPADEEAVAEIKRLMPGPLVYPMDLRQEMTAFELNQPLESPQGREAFSGCAHQQQNSQQDSQAGPVTPDHGRQRRNAEPQVSQATSASTTPGAFFDELLQGLVDQGMVDVAGRYHARGQPAKRA